ncbi:hypothetical protein [uncultured Sphingomonas sp.]|nr:hypothetical protein [uncultured Sphingomonas sp.]
MAERPSSPRRDALIVWAKLVGLLAVVFLFGFVIFALRRSLPH